MSKKKSKFRERVSSNTQKQKTRGSQFGYLNLSEGANQFKEEPGGKMKFDIIPYEVTDPKHPDRDDETGVAVVGELWYKRPFKVHHNIGSGDQRRTVVCPSSIGKKCPICEYRAERREKGADQDEINALNYSYRNLYVVIPRDHKDYEEEPYIWDIAQGNFQKQLNEEIDTDENLGVFPDLEEGLTLKIRFSAETFAKNEYAKTSRIDFVERDAAIDEDILEKVPNLDECLIILSYEELKNLFLELDEETGPDEEGQRTEIPSRHRKMTRQTKDKDDEDDNNIKDKKPPKKDVGKDEDEVKEHPKKKKCPHGHRWGRDCEETDDCDECKMWDECIDAKEELEKKDKDDDD